MIELHCDENMNSIKKIANCLGNETESEIAEKSEKYEAMAADNYREQLEDGTIEQRYFMMKWRECIPQPSCVLITGKRGSGKSVAGYFLLELLGREYGLPAHVFGLPADKAHLLPPSITPIYDLDELPDNAIILFDEAHLSFHARRFGQSANIIMDELITISRQKGQILIFVTQESRKADRNIVASVDCIILKEPAPFQVPFERPELRVITEKALDAFKPYAKENRVKYAFVWSPEYIGILENPTPSFWCDELSRAFSDIPLNQWKSGKKQINLEDMTLEQKVRGICGNKDYIPLLRQITDIEEKGLFDKTFGWQLRDIEGLTGGHISQLMKFGVVRYGYKSNRFTHYRLNVDVCELREIVEGM